MSRPPETTRKWFVTVPWYLRDDCGVKVGTDNLFVAAVVISFTHVGRDEKDARNYFRRRLGIKRIPRELIFEEEE